jgi:hypothetical protein
VGIGISTQVIHKSDESPLSLRERVGVRVVLSTSNLTLALS